MAHEGDEAPVGLSVAVAAEKLAASEAKRTAAEPWISMAKAFGPPDLSACFDRDVVSVAHLPGWPDGPPCGHGWGGGLDRMLGGLVPGLALVVGANRAGAGKTAFVHQLADGLAMRTAELVTEDSTTPLTPIFMLSELSTELMTRRTLARLTGHPSRRYRSGVAAPRYGISLAQATRVFDKGRVALSEGLTAAAREWFHVLHGGMRQRCGADLVAELRETIAAMTSKLEQNHQRPIWPIVVMDPIQRWQDHTKSEVEALNELSERLRTAVDDEGWILIVTSDTNKTSARGAHVEDIGGHERAAGGMRGSYKLLHIVDIALYLCPEAATTVGPGEPRPVTVHVAKNREGPEGQVPMLWDARTGRFWPKPDGDPEADAMRARLTGGAGL